MSTGSIEIQNINSPRPNLQENYNPRKMLLFFLCDMLLVPSTVLINIVLLNNATVGYAVSRTLPMTPPPPPISLGGPVLIE